MAIDLPAAPAGMTWLVDSTLSVRSSTREPVFRLGIYPAGCHVKDGWVRWPKKVQRTYYASARATMREMENPRKLRRLAEAVLRAHADDLAERQQEKAFLAQINSQMGR